MSELFGFYFEYGGLFIILGIIVFAFFSWFFIRSDYIEYMKFTNVLKISLKFSIGVFILAFLGAILIMDWNAFIILYFGSIVSLLILVLSWVIFGIIILIRKMTKHR